MDHCCEKETEELTRLQGRQSRILYTVLWINAAMFVIEAAAGLVAHSTALLADALDMLGDALVYGFSLFVLTRSARWQAGAALAKGAFMMAFGLGVLGEAAYKVVHPVMPGVEAMSVIRRTGFCGEPCVFPHALPASRRQSQHEFNLALFAE
jgi:Co/Zn/Cd efflux system component